MLLCRIIRWELVLILSFILQGVELGPLEITINSLQKSIEARQQEIAELQQMWLRQQSELVQLTKDKDMQSVDVRKLKKQLTILSQKKIRTEGKSSVYYLTYAGRFFASSYSSTSIYSFCRFIIIVIPSN